MENDVVNLTAWVPICSLVNGDKLPCNYDNYLKSLNDIVYSSEYILKKIDPLIDSLNVSIEEPPLIVQNSFRSKSKLYSIKAFHYNINIKYPKTLTTLQYENGKPVEKEPVHISYVDGINFASKFLATDIPQLFIISGLAHPGHTNTLEGMIFHGDTFLCTIDKVDGFHFRYFYNDLWPRIRLMDIKKVFDWFERLCLLRNNSNAWKIFSSYTHILKPNDESEFENLFWAMQALEAFYCNGSEGKKFQLENRISLFLGKWTGKERIISKLYDMRSEFVHGSFPLQPWGLDDFEENKTVTKKYVDLDKYTITSVKLVIATLHRCIQENIYDVDFKTVYEKQTFEDSGIE